MLSQSLITPSIEASSALNKLTICSVSFVGNDEHLHSIWFCCLDLLQTMASFVIKCPEIESIKQTSLKSETLDSKLSKYNIPYLAL